MFRFIFGRPFVKRFTLCYQTVVCPVLSVCDVGVVWPNGWMDRWIKMKLFMQVVLGPDHIALGTQSPPQNGAEPLIFGPYLLWPNGWTDQDATTW